MPARRLILARHGAIHERYRGICYGESDVELGPQGEQQSRRTAAALARLEPTHLFHSGLTRAAYLAGLLADLTGLVPIPDPRLRERSYGAWELRPWDGIFAAVGEAMMGLVNDPAGYAPPGGETTFQLRDRVLDWYRSLPPEGTIVAVSHGGPIAALVGTLEGRPVAEWLSLMPGCGEWREWAETAGGGAGT